MSALTKVIDGGKSNFAADDFPEPFGPAMITQVGASFESIPIYCDA